jgi:hypothetical protein
MKISVSLPTGFEGVMYPVPFVDHACALMIQADSMAQFEDQME